MKTILISLSIFSIICASLFFILCILLIRKMIVLKHYLSYERQSYDCLSSNYDGIREFRHDFSNIMQAINGYLLTNDLNGLKDYYSCIFKDCQEIKKLSVLNKDVLNSPPVLSIMSEKYFQAKDFGIDFTIEVFTDLNKLNMSIYEFARILGIFLDNCIEACSSLQNPIINVVIGRNSIGHFDFLIIENSCPNSVNLDRIFEKNYSTKPKNTGIGLCKVRKIVDHNDNLELDTCVDNGMFRQFLRIYYE